MASKTIRCGEDWCRVRHGKGERWGEVTVCNPWHMGLFTPLKLRQIAAACNQSADEIDAAAKGESDE